jgi:MFS family permease
MLKRWNPWSGLAGLPRGVWILFAVTLINRMGTMVLPFLVLYLTREIGFSAGRAGLVLSVYGIGALCASPLAGRLCDRFGATRVMNLSLFTGGVIFFLFPLAKTWWAILGMSALLAVTAEAFRPASLSIVASIVPPSDLKRAFAAIRLAINLGMSVGPALGGILAGFSFHWLFFIDGATSLLAGALLLAVPGAFAAAQRSADSHPHGAPHRAASSPAAFRDPALLFFLFGVMMIAMVFFQHEGAMPLYLVRDLGLTESFYGMLFTVNTILIVLLEVRLNVATLHWEHRRALALGTVLLGVGFGGLALARDAWGVIATVVIWTFGEMIALPPMSAYVAELAPPDRRGEYMGLYTMSWGIAFTLGPWVGTEALDRFGGTALWAGVCIFSMMAAFVMLRTRSLPKTKARAAEESAGVPPGAGETALEDAESSATPVSPAPAMLTRAADAEASP